jgi:DNA polymerase I-like protein with 3'-5' exonuclease and polymerase domains
MEDNGIKIDLDYLHQLSEKYNKILLEKEAEFYKLCDKYNDKIEAYRQANPNNKLGSMINIASSTQIAILLYDILGEKPVPRQPARGTGEEVLKAIDNEFCKSILEYREVAKLISTYIDKMENVINPNDGKVHCSFNQYGAKTGRFSSQDPNLQNIPSHNKDIRKMFIAEEGNCLISADFS